MTRATGLERALGLNHEPIGFLGGYKWGPLLVVKGWVD